MPSPAPTLSLPVYSLAGLGGVGVSSPSLLGTASAPPPAGMEAMDPWGWAVGWLYWANVPKKCWGNA